MPGDILFIGKKLGFFLLSAAALAALTSLLFIDIHLLHDIVKESSLTEIAQEVILAAIVALYLSLMRNRALRRSSALIGGFFACMLVREMDFAFDLIRHGFWFWVALCIALASLIYAATDLRSALTGLAGFFKHPSYGMVLAGLLNVLVFSRLMGMGELWHVLLQDDYIRTVKNAMEESSELFGYGLCLLMTLQYVYDNRLRRAG